MKYAKDFRADARRALTGKWAIAVIAGLLAVLLGGAGTGSGIEVDFDLSEGSGYLSISGEPVIYSDGTISPEVEALLAGGITVAALLALIGAAISVFLGSVVEIGYARFHLDLQDNTGQQDIATLFRYFPYWRTAVCTALLRGIYKFLWGLLFVIPGIMASYSYAMTGFLLAEHPDLTASEAISRSKELMHGRRWRLFCLHCSFIGWALLSALTLGLGELWLRPYRQAAQTAFYRYISSLAGSSRYLDDEEPWHND